MPCHPALPLIAALLISPAAEAESVARHAAQLTAQADARDNQSLLASLTLPLGEQGWVELGGGRTRSAEPGQAQRRAASLLKAWAGRRWGDWSGALGASRRADGQRLRQTDVQASLDWQGERLDAGVDLLHRDARGREADSEQRLRGPGLGLRAGARFGAARVYAGLTRTDYRSQARVSSPSGGLLGTGLGARSSLVTRDEATLSRSQLLGASWQFSGGALALEHLRDRVLGQPGALRSTQLKGEVDLAAGWSLQPALGRTEDGQAAGVNFGALSLTRRW